MTIASETSRVNLVGNGTNDTFTFTFEIYTKNDILVYVDNVLQEVDVNYTVPIAGIENPDGGTIVFVEFQEPALAAVVSIILNLPYTQLIDYVEADKFPAETHERGLDRLVKIVQQLKERNARQAVLLESSQYNDLTLPDPVASKLLAWKDDLSGIKNVEVESEGDLLVTDYIKTLLDDENAGNARVTLGMSGTSPLSIPPAAFVPELDTYDWSCSWTMLKNRAALTAQYFQAPVFLPNGVTVTKVILYGYRDDADAILRLILARNNRGNDVAQLLADITADWASGYSSITDDSITGAYAIIDNESYHYSLKLEIDPNDSVEDAKFTGAEIEFTY